MDHGTEIVTAKESGDAMKIRSQELGVARISVYSSTNYTQYRRFCPITKQHQNISNHRHPSHQFGLPLRCPRHHHNLNRIHLKQPRPRKAHTLKGLEETDGYQVKVVGGTIMMKGPQARYVGLTTLFAIVALSSLPYTTCFQTRGGRVRGSSTTHQWLAIHQRNRRGLVLLHAAKKGASSKKGVKKRSKKKATAKKGPGSTPDDVYLGPSVELPDILNFDLTGGRPGAIIETEEQLSRKEEIFTEIKSGGRRYPDWFNDYGVSEEDEGAEYDIDDPDAIDASTLGTWDVHDLESRFEYEWDPEADDDPNVIEEKSGFVAETEKDEEGIEVGYDPLFGPSNPVDTRAMVGVKDSYMIDENTKDDAMLAPEFPEGDLEIGYNSEIVQFRKTLDIIETYTDEFLPETLKVPRHVAKWYGYPEPMKYPPQKYTNNRFTEIGKLTNFDAMTPFDARTKAVELARSKNSEWMPEGKSLEWHEEQRKVYEEHGTLVGTLREGECDPDLVEMIQPALRVLGSCVELLSIEQGTVFRFKYHGLIKNKFGMECWTETLIRDCGVEVTGVVFETGFRLRDPAYDGGDPYYAPTF